MVGSIIAAGSVAAVGFTGYGVLNPKSTLLAPSIWHGRTDRPAIALTFDDGPSESTPEILAILQQDRIVATFFQCGVNVRRLPKVACEVKAAGHELANHTDTHPRLCFKLPSFIDHELVRAQETIEQITGAHPVFFRAPFGLRWYGLRRAQKRLGLMGVMWTAIGFDWVRPADQVIEILRGQAANGAIFCLHDGRRTRANPDISATVKAVRALIPILTDKGFCFESVGQMMDHLKAQKAETRSRRVASRS